MATVEESQGIPQGMVIMSMTAIVDTNKRLASVLQTRPGELSSGSCQSFLE